MTSLLQNEDKIAGHWYMMLSSQCEPAVFEELLCENLNSLSESTKNVINNYILFS